MDWKKRGTLLVLVLFLIPMVLGAVGDSKDYENLDSKYKDKFDSLQSVGIVEDSDDFEVLSLGPECKEQCEVSKFCNGIVGQPGCEVPGCSGYFSNAPRPDDSCLVFADELDHHFSDNCAAAAVERGETLTTTPRKLENFVSRDGEGDGLKLIDSKLFTKQGNDAYLCGSTAIETGWMRCAEVNKHKFNVVYTGDTDSNENLQFCVDLDNKPKWVNMETLLDEFDKDGDLVPEPWDCDDNDKFVHPSFGCVEIEDGDVDCSIEATVICGDGKSNTCGEDPSENGADYDSCDNNQKACEENCLEEGESCSFLKQGANGICCGNDGVGDLGDAQRGRVKETLDNYVCLTHDKSLVGYDGEGKESFEGWGNEAGDRCNGRWCWIKASGIAKFNIFTVNEPGEQPYDIVSNGDEWTQCKQGSISNLAPPISGENLASLKRISNRFKCYNEGNHYSWVECGDEETPESFVNKGIKGRRQGEGLYTLPLYNGNDVVKEKTSTDIEISSLKYEKYYSDSFLYDFTGYKYLNFLVKFEENFIPPAGVNLKILGPGRPSVEYFNKNVLGFVINNPLFQQDNFMHVRVELPPEPLKGVRYVQIESPNTITVRNVFLSKENEAENFICSGRDSRNEGESSWLNSADDGDPQAGAVIGETLCTDLYGENAWLGTDIEIDPAFPNANCCGNQINEFYGGDSKGQGDDELKYGCWNSKPVASGETVMDVEYDVVYDDEDKNIDYGDGEDVDFEVLVRNCYTERIISIPEDISVAEFEGNPVDPLRRICGSSLSDVSAKIEPFNSANHFIIEGEQVKETPINHVGAISAKVSNGAKITVKCSPKETPVDLAESTQIITSKEVVTSSDFQGTVYGMEVGTVLQNRCNDGSTPISAKLLVNNQAPISGGATRGVGSSGAIFKNIMVQGSPDKSEVNLPEDNDYRFFTTFSSEPSPYRFRLELTCGREQSFSSVKNNFIYNTDTLNVDNNPLYYILKNSDVCPNRFRTPQDEVKITNNNQNLKVSFLPPEGGASLPAEPELDVDTVEYLTQGVIKVEFDLDVYKPTVNPVPKPAQTTMPSLKYSCDPDDKCIFPIPGEPPYLITNQHPGLYDLYFVAGPGADQRTLITPPNERFEVHGNLQAEKVSQQVIFVNEEIDGVPDRGFYGCSAAEHITDISQLTDLTHCSVKAGYYCGYSRTSETGETTINSWNNNPLPGLFGVDPAQGGENNGIQFITGEVEPKDLTHSTTVLPARNIVTNAKFEIVGGLVPGWDIINNDLTKVRSVPDLIARNKGEDGFLKIDSDKILLSARIPVEKNMDLYFSIDSLSGCNEEVLLFDNDGDEISVSVRSGDTFPTGDAAYLILKMSGCTFKEPTIQNVDEDGEVAFGFDEPDELPRGGAACCPENYCWNGYGCSAPMETLTSKGTAIEVEEDRFYRCINGGWTSQELKTDWRNDEPGFCEDDSQCYVLSSMKSASSENTAESFYNAEFPTCINDGEFIFDNYCDQGEWTSRTKFLASQVLDRVGETTDHSIYCTNIEDTLPELSDDQVGVLVGVHDSGDEVGLGELPTKVCFNTLTTGEGKRLVPTNENRCINNVCVINFRGRTAIATTLNENIDVDNHFTAALNRPKPACTGSGGYKDCEGGLFHSDDLNSIWLSRDGLEPSSGFIENVVDFFRSLLEKRGELTGENFFDKVKNYNQIYSLKKGDKRVLAITEKLTRTESTLIAEFENFDTPVCEYANKNRLNVAAFDVELLRGAAGDKIISCSTDNTVQRIEVAAKGNAEKEGIDFIWPQITAKIRLAEE